MRNRRGTESIYPSEYEGVGRFGDLGHLEDLVGVHEELAGDAVGVPIGELLLAALLHL